MLRDYMTVGYEGLALTRMLELWHWLEAKPC